MNFRFFKIIVVVLLLISAFCSCSINEPDNKNQHITKSSSYEHFINIVSSAGGYIAEYNNLFYFAKSDDQNKIYQMDKNMKNVKKISNKINSSSDLQIQFADNKLFYLQSSGNINSEQFVGRIYLYDFSKNSETAISDRNVCSFIIDNKKIYYSTFDTNSIYVAELDGSNEKIISSNEPSFSSSIQIYKNRLFSCSDEGVYKRDLNGKNIVAEALYPHKLLTYNDKIFYTSDNGGLRQSNINNDSFSNEKVLLNDEVVDFTIFNNKLYFSTMKNKIYKTDLNGKNKKFIVSGSKPIVLSEYLFYIDENGKMLYVSQNK